MPEWVQWLIAAAAVVTALGVLWAKVVRPGFRAAKTADEMLPLLVELTAVFRGNQSAFSVLENIASQFRTDSGSSLRDVVDRLELAADENRQAAEILKIGAEATRQLAVRDREQVERIVLMVDRLTVKVDAVTSSAGRIEAAARIVASDLVKAQEAVDGVAIDLAEAHVRADEVEGHPGEAADAASRSPRDDS